MRDDEALRREVYGVWADEPQSPMFPRAMFRNAFMGVDYAVGESVTEEVAVFQGRIGEVYTATIAEQVERQMRAIQRRSVRIPMINTRVHRWPIISFADERNSRKEESGNYHGVRYNNKGHRCFLEMIRAENPTEFARRQRLAQDEKWNKKP